MFGPVALLGIASASVIVALRSFGRFNNPVTLYTLPWLICSLLAASGLFGIYNPSETTLMVIALSLVGFLIGAVGSKEIFETSRSCCNDGDIQQELRRMDGGRALTVLFVIGAVVSLLYLVRTVPELLSGKGFEYVKFQYSNAEGATLFSTRELLLFQWVVIPIYHLAFISFALDLSKLTLNRKALLFSIIGMMVIVLVSGGRNSIFVFLVICTVGVLSSDNKASIWELIKGLPAAVKCASLVAVLVLIYITQERSLSEDAGVLENVFFYFAGAIRYLDYILGHPDLFGIGGELFYGGGLMGFLVNPLNLICSMVFGYDYLGTDSLVSSAASLYIPFSDELSGNALCTCIYPFIRDFGMVGVVVGPLLYGVLSSFVWGKAFSGEGAHALAWRCIWIYYAYCLLFSEWRYTLIFPATGFTFLLVWFVFGRSTVRTQHGRVMDGRASWNRKIL